jgi:hypothetical protein
MRHKKTLLLNLTQKTDTRILHSGVITLLKYDFIDSSEEFLNGFVLENSIYERKRKGMKFGEFVPCVEIVFTKLLDMTSGEDVGDTQGRLFCHHFHYEVSN